VTPAKQATADGAPSKRGRPRSVRAWKAVLEVAEEILETEGYAALTVDAVAARAGVSKATIYRWWDDKAAVAMEAVLNAIEPEIAAPDTGSLKGDLESQVLSVIEMLTTTPHGPALAGLIAEAQSNPTLAEAFRERFLKVRRTAARELLGRAVARGEVDPSTDLEVAVDAIYGPVYYRLLLGHRPLDERFGRTHLALVCDGLTARD
jgi:AcrR family transcriptional regulator